MDRRVSMINGDALVSINQAVCYELQAITKKMGRIMRARMKAMQF